MFSCLHLTSAHIQVLLPRTERSTVNNPAFFDLIGYFKLFDIDEHFWAAALSQIVFVQSVLN